MSLSTNAVASKAKSMYGKRLLDEHYQELLRKHSVPEIATFLKTETVYQEALADVRENAIHRGDLEHLLRQAGFLRMQKLLRYVGKKNQSFYNFVVKEQEIDLILMRLRTINSDLYEAFNTEIPVYLEKYISFNLRDLLNAEDFDALLKVLERTGYDEVLKSLKPENRNQKVNYVACEYALHAYFYDWIFKTIDSEFKGKTKKELLTIFESQVELLNIAKIYRYKRFFDVDSQTIYNSLILTHQRMSNKFLKKLTEAEDDVAILNILAASNYQIMADDKDYVFIEYYADKVKYNLSRRYMRFSTNASMVFTTFYVMQKLEIENLINIIEGVRYGTPSENIEKMLIY